MGKSKYELSANTFPLGMIKDTTGWFEEPAFLCMDEYFCRGAAPTQLVIEFCDAIYEDVDSRHRKHVVADVVSSVVDKRTGTGSTVSIFESINAYVYDKSIDLVKLVERIKALERPKVQSPS
jgi:hypothetical protein